MPSPPERTAGGFGWLVGVDSFCPGSRVSIGYSLLSTSPVTGFGKK